MAELENTMLTLAAISYCGYNLTLPEPLKSAHLRQAMTQLLNKLPSVKGQWIIVWGPATFSAAVTLQIFRRKSLHDIWRA